MTCLANERDALEAVIAHVAEDSFFAMTDPAPPDWRDSAAGLEWLDAAVSYHGGGNGVLTCRLPMPLALDLTAAFLGAGPDDLPPSAVPDMVGELANMICGCWLTRAYPTELFDLGRPAVASSADGPGDDWLVLLLNGMPVGVSVHAAR